MKWTNIFTRDYGVQYCEVILTAMSDECDSIASVIKNGIIYPKKGNEAFYIIKESFDRLNYVIEKLLDDEKDIDGTIKLFKKCGNEFVETAKSINKMDLENSSNEKLLESYEKYRGIWQVYTSHLWTTFYLSVVFAQKTEKLLTKKSTEKSNKNFKKLVGFASTPSEEASILGLNRKLTELKKEHNDKKLEEILSEYRWIPCLDLHNQPWSKEDLIEYSKDYVPPKENKPTEKEIIEEFELSEEEIKGINLNKKLAYIRDLRDEYRRIGIYNIQKLYKEIGKRMNLELNEMSFVRDTEIKEFLKQGKLPDKKIINERPNGFLMFKKEGEKICIIGDEIEKEAKEIGFELEDMEEKEIRGTPASKGKIRGKVKVILTARDLDKVSEGDILVALTTGPDYVPAMHKAAAFVTDEGGITCHAAIVAREMGKPCVVGTKNATTILNDGDLVEVNAEIGIVKKISEN